MEERVGERRRVFNELPLSPLVPRREGMVSLMQLRIPAGPDGVIIVAGLG